MLDLETLICTKVRHFAATVELLGMYLQLSCMIFASLKEFDPSNSLCTRSFVAVAFAVAVVLLILFYCHRGDCNSGYGAGGSSGRDCGCWGV